MSNIRAWFVLVLACLSLGACANPRVQCGEGRAVDDFCAYTSPIVIEGGFHCPRELPERFDFGETVLCGPVGTRIDVAFAACSAAGLECDPPSCDVAPDSPDCRPVLEDGGGVADAGFAPCDAGPIDFCRELLPEGSAGCCGVTVAPLCRVGGGGYACPEGSIESSACTADCP